MAQQDAVLGGTVHDAAQRAADVLSVFVCPAAADEPAGHTITKLAAVLREHGEPEPVELGVADVAALRRAARQLRTVFEAGDAAEAAMRINALLAQFAHPPRLTTHGGGASWHLHVDSRDDAPWDEWFLTASCLALAVLLADRQAPPAGICASRSCGKPFVNVGRGSARRYCSAACGTRERVAAHRARR